MAEVQGGLESGEISLQKDLTELIPFLFVWIVVNHLVMWLVERRGRRFQAVLGPEGVPPCRSA